MRGLPFPQDAAFERETSCEYGTPASNFDDIPIDPALADPPIDPALAFPVKIDPDQVRVRLYRQRATRLLCCGCGAPLAKLIDRVASRRPSLNAYRGINPICILIPTFFPGRCFFVCSRRCSPSHSRVLAGPPG